MTNFSDSTKSSRSRSSGTATPNAKRSNRPAFALLPWLNVLGVATSLVAIGLIAANNNPRGRAADLLNVSYDPTRELYQHINTQFVASHLAKTGKHVTIDQSHGGSSRQSRAVAQGTLQADIVTLGLPSDVEALHKCGLLADGWDARLPNHSRPYYSTIVFVVSRRGNPRSIHDWPDVIKPGVEVIVPDPKSSGNGKLVALAAWGAIITRGGTESQARDYLKQFYDHAPFLLGAARAAGVAFALEKIGDVHLAWENEALREASESKGQLEIVNPPVSILAEPTVALVDANVRAHGTAILAKSYLEYLFSPEGQETIAQEGYRPSDQAVFKRHATQFSDSIKLFPITTIARDWDEAQQRFFGDNGIVETAYKPKPR